MNDRLMHHSHGHFIDNRIVPSGDEGTIPVIDPSTGDPWGTIARGQAADIAHAVASARRSYDGEGIADGPWGRCTALERGRILRRLADAVERARDELAGIEARDTGKPLRQAVADANALARYFEFYAGAADKLHGQTIPYQLGYTVLTLREPYGVTGHIIPWNYPMQIFGRSVGASLAAGNACVVKPAEDACLSLLRVAELAAEAGLPPGALNIVTGLGAEAGQALAEHAGVDHLSFTGSPATGTRVAQACAANHRPVTLELGGKSPQIVFDDADLDDALPVLVNAIIQNAGQTCSAGSRVLVQAGIHAEVQELLAKRFASLIAGPALADRDLGPIINARQRDRIMASVDAAIGRGARILARGSIDRQAPNRGFYLAPVLLTGAADLDPIAQEETFGPVLLTRSFEDEAEALRIANGTPYGLVAGVWTRDGARQFRMARKLRAGQVFVNNYGAGGGVELPFGGVGRSGHGREKGFEALFGFTTLKTVAIRHG